jgi:hypothetical protein
VARELEVSASLTPRLATGQDPNPVHSPQFIFLKSFVILFSQSFVAMQSYRLPRGFSTNAHFSIYTFRPTNLFCFATTPDVTSYAESSAVYFPPRQVKYLFTLFMSMGPDCRCNDLDREKRRNSKKKRLSATLSTTNSTFTDPRANPCLRCERPAINSLSHDTISLIGLLTLTVRS